jgi:hypothetical protein
VAPENTNSLAPALTVVPDATPPDPTTSKAAAFSSVVLTALP